MRVCPGLGAGGLPWLGCRGSALARGPRVLPWRGGRGSAMVQALLCCGICYVTKGRGSALMQEPTLMQYLSICSGVGARHLS